jgi:hypothetical protein
MIVLLLYSCTQKHEFISLSRSCYHFQSPSGAVNPKMRSESVFFFDDTLCVQIRMVRSTCPKTVSIEDCYLSKVTWSRYKIDSHSIYLVMDTTLNVDEINSKNNSKFIFLDTLGTTYEEVLGFGSNDTFSIQLNGKEVKLVNNDVFYTKVHMWNN